MKNTISYYFYWADVLKGKTFWSEVKLGSCFNLFVDKQAIINETRQSLGRGTACLGLQSVENEKKGILGF